jgi:hypothetical protein
MMPLTIRRRLIDRVRQWRKIAYAACVALILVAAAAVFLSVSSPESTIEVASGPTFFDAGRAYRLAEAMWQNLSLESTGSEEQASIVNWIISQLPTAEMAKTDSFRAPMGDEEVTLQNIAVVLEGTSKETIVVAAPRDTPTVVKVEPLTWTSGTGVLLELIQVFSARPHQKTLVFLSTEDASNGGLGISHFLDSSGLGPYVSTILSIHGLGKESSESGVARKLSVGITSAQGTTPGWYLQLVGRVLAEGGLDLKVPGLLSQAADHALSLSKGDQVAGLTRGIASLRLYDEGAGNPSADGLAKQGPAIERLLLSLDSGAEAPPDPGTALLLKSGRFLTNRAVTVLAVLCLFPTLAVLFIWLFASRLSMRAALRHLRNLVSFALPLALLFIWAFILALGGLIPRYRFQVPTVDGPGTQPRAAPTIILLLLGAVGFVASRRFLGYFRPKEPRPVTEMAKLCAGFLSLLLGMILILSRSPFLILPCLAAAWAWPLATCFAEPVYSGALWRQRLTTNLPLLLFGLVVPVALYSYVAFGHGVGWWKTWWYMLVQLVSGAYGIRGIMALMFVTTAFALLLGVKRMRVVPIETLDATDDLSMLELPVPRARRKQQTETRPPLSPWG